MHKRGIKQHYFISDARVVGEGGGGGQMPLVVKMKYKMWRAISLLKRNGLIIRLGFIIKFKNHRSDVDARQARARDLLLLNNKTLLISGLIDDHNKAASETSQIDCHSKTPN